MDSLHKHDECCRVQKCKGNVLYLAPYPRFVEGDGLFLKHGNGISDGARLLMGKNSPFWDGYCNYLFRRDVLNKVLCLSSLSLAFVVEQYGQCIWWQYIELAGKSTSGEESRCKRASLRIKL